MLVEQAWAVEKMTLVVLLLVPVALMSLAVHGLTLSQL